MRMVIVAGFLIVFMTDQKMLNMSPEFVWGCWRVMEGLYTRDRVDHQKVLKKMKQDYPDSGVSETGTALMWQVLMLEEF